MSKALKVIAIASACLFAVIVAAIIIKPGKPKTVDLSVTFDKELGWSPDWWSPDHDGPNDRSLDEVRQRMFMGQHQQEAKKENQYIVMMGDSVLFGTGVQPSQTSAAKLKHLMSGVEIFNMSVTGYSVDQYYLYLKRHLSKLHTRLIVVGLYSENDFSGTIRNNQYGGQKPLFVIKDSKLVLTNPEIPKNNCLNTLSRSALFHALWRITHPRFDGTNKAGKTPEDAKRQEHREDINDFLDAICDAKSLDYEHGEQVLRALLDKIVELGTEHNSKVLFVVLPGEGHFTSNHYLESPPDPRLKFFQRVLKESGHIFLDFFEYIKGTQYYDSSCTKTPQACPVRPLYLDGGHYTEEGHELMAKAIFEKIQADELLSPHAREIDNASDGPKTTPTPPPSDIQESEKRNPDYPEDVGAPASDLAE